jgi:predicted enzyme related to lactoylglutathione lyase
MAETAKNPVVHFEVLGRDAAALRSFYSEVFGWPLGPPDGGPLEYSMVNIAGEGAIAGGIGKSPQGPGHVTFYVGVDDLEASLQQVGRLGGKTVQPPVQLPGGGSFALFADPEGHVLGLVKG